MKSVCEKLGEEIVEFRKIVTEKSRKVEWKIASGRIANDGLSMETQMIARNKNVRLYTEGATRNGGKLEGGFYEKGDREFVRSWVWPIRSLARTVSLFLVH